MKKPPSTIYAPPQSLSPAAQKLWKSLAVSYAINDAAGRVLLEAACTSWDLAQTASARVKKDGLMTPDRYGCLRAHPMLNVARTARAQMLHAFAALRLDVEPLKDTGRPAIIDGDFNAY